MEMLNVLSVDAWKDGCGNYSWNDWHKLGEISLEKFESLNTNRKLIAWFRGEGYIGNGSKGKVGITNTDYNICVTDRRDGRPLYAICYGEIVY